VFAAFINTVTADCVIGQGRCRPMPGRPRVKCRRSLLCRQGLLRRGKHSTLDHGKEIFFHGHSAGPRLRQQPSFKFRLQIQGNGHCLLFSLPCASSPYPSTKASNLSVGKSQSDARRTPSWWRGHVNHGVVQLPGVKSVGHHLTSLKDRPSVLIRPSPTNEVVPNSPHVSKQVRQQKL